MPANWLPNLTATFMKWPNFLILVCLISENGCRRSLSALGQKQTFSEAAPMSAKCQKQTLGPVA